MAIRTRLTTLLGIRHPILLAPMGFVAGGQLAAAVTRAGGLGIIGGGYGDADWIDAQFREAGNETVGCGFITWSLAEKPGLLARTLAHRPKVVFLSFGDPQPFADAIKASGALLLCQVQSRADAEAAVAAHADVIIAQGTEAGGHGEKRATSTLVPEIADLLAARSPDTLLCSAGGIADGRGLAAALMLGADGVVVGTRLWASCEAVVHEKFQQAAIGATGDDTVRQKVIDIVRGYDWPERFDIRVMRNRFVDAWIGQEARLRSAIETERPRYAEAQAEGNASIAASIVGEAIGLVRSIEPAAAIITGMVAQAEAALARGQALVDDVTPG